MTTAKDPSDESQHREEIRLLAEEFAQSLADGGQPDMQEFLDRIPPTLRDDLRKELVGELFAHRFGDASDNGTLLYRPVALLGKGTFGEVYKAHDVKLDRLVALKVLLNTERPKGDQFLRELRVQAKLPKHDHLVAVHHSGKLPKGHSYAVLQYVDGGTLQKKLKSEGRLDVEAAARLMEQVALAVATVHEGISGSKGQQPLVHRDLKPSNILLDRSGNALVADFGITAAVGDIHSGIANAGGTFAYMSPEQATAFRPGVTPASVDTRSDVWALGVVLYELITGHQPFVSYKDDSKDRRDEILEAIQRDEPPQMRDICRDVPPELERLVGLCLKKDKAERIQSAREIAAHLRRWLDSVSAIPAPLDFSARLAEARKDFSDRPWLFDEVDAWPAHQNERLLLLTGELGSGKSAFLAELIDRNPEKRILAWHLCRHDWPESRSAARFVRGLAGMLATRVEDYRSKLADLSLREALAADKCERDPASAFQDAVVTPFFRLQPPGDGVWFIIVDALDEADLSGSSSIPELLEQWARQLPGWLRIIASLRRGALKSDSFVGIRQLDIDRDNTGHNDDVRDDLLRFIQQRLSQPNLAERLQQSHMDTQAVAETLMNASEANFLYVSEALAAIERDQFAFDDKLSPGLNGLYEAFFHRQWTNRRIFEGMRPILEALVAAREPLHEELIAAAASPGDQLDERLASLEQYLDRSDDKVQLRHKALSEWLTSTNCMFKVRPEEGHKRLAAACLKEYDVFKEGNAHLSPYIVKHLPHHLVVSKNWKALAELLTDLPFIQAKVESGFIFELISDLLLAYNAMPPKNRQRGVINEIAAVLADQAAFLAKHPDYVFQCLNNATAPVWCETAGSPQSHSLKAAVDQWQSAGAPQRAWVRTLRRPEPSHVTTYRFHNTAITTLAILQPKGEGHELVASAAEDGTLRLWDSAGKLLDKIAFPYNQHVEVESESPVSLTTRSRHFATSCCWAAGSSSIFTGNTRGSLQRWRLNESLLFQRPADQIIDGSPAGESPVRVVCVAASSSGSRCAAVYKDGRALLDLDDGHHSPLHTLDGDQFTCAAFSPLDDSLLIAATTSGKVRNIRLREGTWEPWMGTLDSRVTSLAFAPDGRLLACATENRRITCFAVSTEGDIEPFGSEDLSIAGVPTSISISRDGRSLALVTNEGEVLVAGLNSTGQLFSPRKLVDIGATCIAASTTQAAAFYVGTRGGEIRLLDGRNTSCAPMPTWSAIGWNGEMLGLARSDGSVQVFDLPQCATSVQIDLKAANVGGSIKDGMFFDHDRRVVLATDSDEVVVIDLANDAHWGRHRLAGRFLDIGGAMDAPLFAVVEAEGALTIWNADRQAPNTATLSLGWQPSCVCVNRDGSFVAVGGQDATLYRGSDNFRQIGSSVLEWLRSNCPDLLQNSRLDERWLAEDGGQNLFPEGDFTATQLGISSVALSDDGALLVMGLRSNAIACLPSRALDGHRTDIEIYEVPDVPNGTRWIVEVCVSPDKKKLAARQSNGRGFVVDRQTRQWHAIGWCAAIGDWAFESAIGLFSLHCAHITEVRDIRTAKTLAFLPEPLELVGIGRDGDSFVARRRPNGHPVLLQLQR